QACEDAVAAEHRHEPGKARRRQRVSRESPSLEPQRGEVDETPSVGPSERVGVRLEARGSLHPLVETPCHPPPGLPRRVVAAIRTFRSSGASWWCRIGGCSTTAAATIRSRITERLAAAYIVSRPGTRKSRVSK